MAKSTNPWQSAWPSGLSEVLGTVPIKFTAQTATVAISHSDRAYAPRTLTEARLRVAAAPAGSALTILVQHFNGTTWGTIGTLTMADGATTPVTIELSQAQSTGQLLRLNTTSVGSGTAAVGVAVDILAS